MGSTYRKCACGRWLSKSERRCDCGGQFTWAYIERVSSRNGRRVRKSKSGFPTKRSAEAALADLKQRVAAHRYVEPSRTTVGRYLTDDWLPVSTPPEN